MGLQRVRHDWVTEKQQQYTYIHKYVYIHIHIHTYTIIIYRIIKIFGELHWGGIKGLEIRISKGMLSNWIKLFKIFLEQLNQEVRRSNIYFSFSGRWKSSVFWDLEALFHQLLHSPSSHSLKYKNRVLCLHIDDLSRSQRGHSANWG